MLTTTEYGAEDMAHYVPLCSPLWRPNTPPGGWFVGRSEQPAK